MQITTAQVSFYLRRRYKNKAAKEKSGNQKRNY
jgi:hypothetical protein